MPRPEGAKPPRPASRLPPRRAPAEEIVAVEEAPSGTPPRLAIVVDDLGNDPRALERLLQIREPLTGAVLPGLPRSRETAIALSRAGKEVLLHLPMEPLDAQIQPGPGLIRDSMSSSDVETTLQADLIDVPGAVGVNNHMGSKGTADRRIVTMLLQGLSRRRLFFLDSRTTSETVVPEEGARSGVVVLSRDVFLDDSADPDSIERQLDSAEDVARREGRAIAIGHPRPSTLAALERRLPLLRERGITACRVSSLSRGPSPRP